MHLSIQSFKKHGFKMLQAARASAPCPSLSGSSLGPCWGRAEWYPHMVGLGAAGTGKSVRDGHSQGHWVLCHSQPQCSGRGSLSWVCAVSCLFFLKQCQYLGVAAIGAAVGALQACWSEQQYSYWTRVLSRYNWVYMVGWGCFNSADAGK